MPPHLLREFALCGHTQSIHDVFSWNALTPYYKEIFTLSKGELETRSDALGVSTMLYFQMLFKANWEVGHLDQVSRGHDAWIVWDCRMRRRSGPRSTSVRRGSGPAFTPRL